MAVYKDEDITTALIMKKFPSIATELSNSNQATITADTLEASNNDVFMEVFAMGIDKGATAETARIKDIDTVNAVGYSQIIADAKADGISTSRDVKLAIFDAREAKEAKVKTAHKADGEALADVARTIGDTTTEVSDDDKAIAMMAEARIK